MRKRCSGHLDHHFLFDPLRGIAPQTSEKPGGEVPGAENPSPA
jgi:hypothetical protein